MNGRATMEQLTGIDKTMRALEDILNADDNTQQTEYDKLKRDYDKLKLRFDKIVEFMDRTANGVYINELDDTTPLYCMKCNDEVLAIGTIPSDAYRCLTCNKLIYLSDTVT